VTALNLGDATRLLTPPSAAFSTVAFGDVEMVPNTVPHPVTAFAGGHLIPRATADGASTLTSDTTLAPSGDHAIFLAFSDLSAASNSALLTGPLGLLVVSANSLVAAQVDDTYIASAVPLVPALGAGVVVFALVGTSSETIVATNVHGVIATGDAGSTPAAATMYLPPTAGGLLGVWEFDDTTVDAETAVDTAQAIAALVYPSVGVEGATSWGINATGVITVGDIDEPTLPDPGDSAGSQEPPSWPDADFAPDGVAPIRHVSETMPAPVIVDGRVDMDAWQPTARTDAPWAYRRVVAEGVDITAYLGAELPSVMYTRSEPFGPRSARIDLPQITPWVAIPAWAKPGANVSIQYLLIDSETVQSAWEGVVTGTSVSDDTGHWGLDCIGVVHASDYQLRKPSTSTAPQDIGTLIPAIMNGAISRRTQKMAKVTTGIARSVAGGWEPTMTGFVQELLATALKDGRQWTVTCAERTPVLARKNTTTVDVDVRFGQRGITVDIQADSTDWTNAIYAEGVAPDGGRWMNWKYPNWHPDDTPRYPFASPSRWITVGMRDADTDTGNGVSVWEAKMGLPVDGYYSQSDANACGRMQERLGILRDRVIGPQTWAATFDTGANTGTLDGAFIAPLASSPKVEPRRLGPDGDDLGANSAYDASILRIEDKVNFGQGYTKAQATPIIREMLARSITPGWAGSITFTMDPPQMSRFAIREGMNVKVRGIHGQDLLLHVTQVDVASEQVRITVDSKARDYPTVQAMATADRNATDPAKLAINRLLKGAVQTDRATFDAESPGGRMPKHAVNGGLWDVRRIPLGVFGTVVRTDWYTSSPTRFSLAVFGKPVTAAQLLAWVGDPLTADEDPWEDDSLEDKGLLQAWGWRDQPAGYWPKTYWNHTGARAVPVTGRLVDDASWEFASARAPWVWVAMMTAADCYAWGRFYGRAGD